MSNKIMQFGLLISLVILLLFFGCVTKPVQEVQVDETSAQPAQPAIDASAVDDSDWTYVSSPLFYIYYPKGWDYQQDTTTGTFSFASPLEDKSDKVMDEFVIEIWEGNEATPEEFEAAEKSIFPKDAVVNSKEQTAYKGRDAFVMEYEGTNQEAGTKMYFKTTYIRNGDWVYRLHYAIEKSKIGIYKPTMEKILEKLILPSP